MPGSKCLPCKNFEYNYYENDTYFTKYYYTLIQNYCLYKNSFFDKQNSKITLQMKFNNQHIDYLRNELEKIIYFCKVRK